MLFDIELPNELKGFLFYAQVSFEKTNVAITVYMYMYKYTCTFGYKYMYKVCALTLVVVYRAWTICA